MAYPSKNPERKNGHGANLGFEDTLWAAADKMRGQMDSAEYKHVVLGLIFLKYISDAFEERFQQLQLWSAQPAYKAEADQPETRYHIAEDRESYQASNVFWVPPEARWSRLQAQARRPDIGQLVDTAMEIIERENPSLRGVLPHDYARAGLDKQRLGELIELIGTIPLGDAVSRSKDILGRVYEYFLDRFANSEGKGGEFYTPQSVVRLLVEAIEPYHGRVYDPCCGSGGMFVQSERFALAHGGQRSDLSIYGQESNLTTWRLCKLNLAIRGIEGDIGPRHADSFHNDLHDRLQADFILANPPFNISDWRGELLRHDLRWRYGVPPTSNANFAWVQHIIHHLAPNGLAGFVLANGSLTTNAGGEAAIRAALIEEDLIDCIVALPNQLFYTTQIAACLWFIARNKNDPRFRDRRGETLFVYAYPCGQLRDRVHRELTAEEIARIADAYHAWRRKDSPSAYQDIPGFCRVVTLEEIRAHKMALVPGRYVGFDEALSKHWDLSRLRAELAEVEMRITQINNASQAAINVLKDLLYG